MAFANLSVLALGSLLIGIPLLLHLMMKQQPRHQVFPALRFLQQRQLTNQRQMRLRNGLLLAMRLAAVVLLALLLSRPSVDSAQLGFWLRALLSGLIAVLVTVACLFSWTSGKGKRLTGALVLGSVLAWLATTYFGVRAGLTVADSQIGDAQAPVAAVLVIDTSPRMGLQHENETRLEVARKLARELLTRLPSDSEVAIVDAAASGVFSHDRGAAINLLDSLQVGGAEYPLSELVQRGMELVASREELRQEVYVFSDLSRASWEPSAYSAVRSTLEQSPGTALFVLDVGAEQPRNVQLGELTLSSQTLRKGQVLRLDVGAQSSHIDQEATVTVKVETPDPTLPLILDGDVVLPESVGRDRATVTLQASTSQALSFDLTFQSPGIHHGYVEIDVEDGLPVDNRRYFTVSVRAPWRALLVPGAGAATRYVEAVMSPIELRAQGMADFECQVVTPAGMLDETLSSYDVVVLLDPDVMTPEHWQRLNDYVRTGGGLALGLGRNAAAEPDEFNRAAGSLLPGSLADVRSATPPAYFRVALLDHPSLIHVRGREALIPWDAAPVNRYWTFRDWKPASQVILEFTSGAPALIESMIGDGRVMTFATPLSDLRNQTQRPAWNAFPNSGEDGFAFFAVNYGMFPYLAGHDALSWNHRVGDAVSLPLASGAVTEQTWLLFTPQRDWQNLRSQDGQLTVRNTQWPGTYRLKDVEQPTQGFSVNLPPAATNLTRLTESDLAAVLGEDNYTYARGAVELDRRVGQVRVGRELFPFVALVVIALLALEHLMSNRFYGLTGRATVPQQPSLST